MLKILPRFVVLLLAMPALALAADCTPPDPPTDMPDGKTASKEAMIETQQEIKAYVKEGDRYVACMDEAANQVAAELKELRGGDDAAMRERDQKDAELTEIVEDRNAVVNEMKHIADLFNAEIDEFQARGSDDS